MTRRKPDQRDRDRADLLAVLEEYGEQPTNDVIARALGFETALAMWKAYPWPAMQQALRDLDWLHRQGKVAPGRTPVGHATWRIATDEDRDAEEDARDVARLEASWEPAP